MKTIQIWMNKEVIPLNLVISANQAIMLREINSQSFLKKLMVEIALYDENVPLIIAAVMTQKFSEDTAIGLCLADDELSPEAWMDNSLMADLRAVGDLVTLSFQIKGQRPVFDLDALGISEDTSGKLRLLRLPGPVLKK